MTNIRQKNEFLKTGSSRQSTSFLSYIRHKALEIFYYANQHVAIYNIHGQRQYTTFTPPLPYYDWAVVPTKLNFSTAYSNESNDELDYKCVKDVYTNTL